MNGVKTIALILFLFFNVRSLAQANHFNFFVGAGPSWFLNTPPVGKNDRMWMLGTSYSLANKNQNFVFNPGIGYRRNIYTCYFTDHINIQSAQQTVNFDLDVLMNVHKKLFVEVGLVYTLAWHTDLSYWSYGTNLHRTVVGAPELYDLYHPAVHQAGVNVGIGLPFRLFKRNYHRFHIKLCHYGTQVVAADFRVIHPLDRSEVIILSAKSRPTMVVFLLEFNLKKKKKEATED